MSDSIRVLATFDSQLHRTHRKQLVNELRLSEGQTMDLATSIYHEASTYSVHLKEKIRSASPVPILDRLNQVEQSIAFNAYCSPGLFQSVPGLAHAHTVTLCYVSFVFLNDGLFDVVKRGGLASTSLSRMAVNYLRNNPVRSFRNAIAHGNWRIRQDGSAIDYWARPGRIEDGIREWSVSQQDLIFWYAIARAVAYALLTGSRTDHGVGLS